MCESYILRPLTSAHCFPLTGFTVWTRAKDVIWTSINQSWCNQSSAEDKLNWPCSSCDGRRCSVDGFDGDPSPVNTSYCVSTSHTSALAKYIFDAVVDLCLIFCCVQTDRPQLHWSLWSISNSPSTCRVCVCVWLFLHFRAEKVLFFECYCSEKEKGSEQWRRYCGGHQWSRLLILMFKQNYFCF